MTRTSRAKNRLGKLSELLDGAKTMLIVMQNNPDPDAIAAAAALREIANEKHGVACSLAHGGTVGRAENAALLKYLTLNTRALSTLDVERFDRVAMVDAQPGAGNVGLDSAVRLDLVIDHHPIRRETRSAHLTDIRRNYGATSTILFEYLTAAGIAIQPPLATALVYGIRSDTQDLGRETTKADIEAFLALYPLANPRALGRIVAAPLPRGYFSKLRRALDNAELYEDRVVTFLDVLESQEMIAESADLLLRVEDVKWAMCLGVVGDVLHVSIRTTEREPHAGTVARKLASQRGFGGGHVALAGAQIPLRPLEQEQPVRLHLLVDGLVKRFLGATGNPSAPGEPLCLG